MSISARRVVRAAQFGVALRIPTDLVPHRYYETDLPPEELGPSRRQRRVLQRNAAGSRGARSEHQVAPLRSAGWASTRPWSPACRRAPSHRIRRLNRRRSVPNCALRAAHSKSTVCRVVGNGAGGQWHGQTTADL